MSPSSPRDGYAHRASGWQHLALLKNRHDAIQNDIKVLAQSGGIRADDRRLTVFRAIDEDDGKRPDLLLPGLGEDDKDLLLDIKEVMPQGDADRLACPIIFPLAKLTLSPLRPPSSRYVSRAVMAKG